MYSSSGESQVEFPPPTDLLAGSSNLAGTSPAQSAVGSVDGAASPQSDTRPAKRRPGAYELKFLLPDEIADELLAAVRPFLPPDPHAEPAPQTGEPGECYRIHSLYLDTPQFEVFRRIGSHGRRKFRLRRYGDEPRIWAERKSKSLGRVVKRRSPLDPAVLPELSLPAPPSPTAESSEPTPGQPLSWFRRRIQRRLLQPICQIAYRRIARVGQGTLQGLRLTVDRGLQGQRAAGWLLTALDRPLDLLRGESIVEMKFPEAMPDLFKQLIGRYALTPQTISKYRWMVQALQSAGTVVIPADLPARSASQ